ncbi:MAG: PLP-dependent aminotransferase family protein [Aggregatilineales bacterium]
MEKLVDYAISLEANQLERSVMRDLIRLISNPAILSLAGGLPADEFLPTEVIRDCMNTVLLRDGGKALQYGAPYAPLRAWIADYMQLRGVTCTPEQVFVTNGNQQGLAILSRLFLDRGSTAVTEAITFTGIQQATAGRGATVLTVPTDLETGVDVDALEHAFAQSPQLAVLIPDFHNPLGVSMSLEKRQLVAQLAAAYSVPLVEDDPYSALRFEGETLPPIKAFDEAGRVFYLGSFSKMLAPALRLGWMIAPQELLPRITTLRESLDLESSTLIQRTVAEFLSRGLLPAHLEQLNQNNLERRNLLLAGLDKYFADIAQWTTPQGGLFVWMTLPEHIDTWAMFDDALAHNVAYIPGGAFSVNKGHKNTLRLNFSKLAPEQLHEAVRRLYQVVSMWL